MKLQRTAWIILVVFSLSAYIFLESRQQDIVFEVEEEKTEEFIIENPAPAAHPDLWLIRKGIQSLARLLPAS